MTTIDSSTGGEPLDLDADRARFAPQEALIAAAFRGWLEPEEAQTRRLIAGLANIEGRARRGHRRQVWASGVAVVATAGAVALIAPCRGRRLRPRRHHDAPIRFRERHQHPYTQPGQAHHQ